MRKETDVNITKTRTIRGIDFIPTDFVPWTKHWTFTIRMIDKKLWAGNRYRVIVKSEKYNFNSATDVVYFDEALDFIRTFNLECGKEEE